MKLLLSINDRILEKVNINELMNLIKEYDINNNISGIELCSNNKEYLINNAKECINNNFLLQFHAPALEDDGSLFNYLDNIYEVSKLLKYKVNIVFHSLYVDINNLDNKDTYIYDSIKITNKYLDKIITYIKENNYDLNINISVENLNILNNIKRINIDNIDKVLLENNDVLFTYDMGHDLYDNKVLTKLSNIQLSKINNVHIHSIKNNIDHYPIYKDNNDFYKIKNGIKYLENNNYDGNIVLEYAVDYIEKISYKDKLINYIKLFNVIKNI